MLFRVPAVMSGNPIARFTGPVDRFQKHHILAKDECFIFMGDPGNLLPGREAQEAFLLPSARATSCPCHPGGPPWPPAACCAIHPWATQKVTLQAKRV